MNWLDNTMSALPQVSIIIPNWNTRPWLAGCLEALRGQSYQDFEVFVVDNGSGDGSVAFVRQHYPEVKLLTFTENRGFAAAANAGIAATQTDYVVLLNVDTIPRPDWLLHLVQVMDQSPPEVGSVTSKMLSLKNPEILDDAGNLLSWYGSAKKRGKGEPAEQYDQLEEVFSACAGAALYRRSFLEAVGGFDENFVSYLEDVDLGLRGRLYGYRCLYVPTAQVLHQWQGAGLPRPQYVYFSTRNRLTLLFKNIPGSLLLKHAFTLLYGQFYFLLAYKKPFHSLAGIASFLAALPRIWRQRRSILARQRISRQELDDLLNYDLGEPALRTLLKAKLKRN